MTAPVHRPIVFSSAGMVVSGHHRASEAGAAVLRGGGNAVDAAVATSAALCVALPHMNGIGGDCFALCYDAASHRVTTINGSGGAPIAADPALFAALGHSSIPPRGPLSISVCGLVDAWQSALQRFGSRRCVWPELLAPAIALAEHGGEVDLSLQDYFASAAYAERVAATPSLAEIFGTPGVRALGTRLPQPALAASLRQIAELGAAALYSGPLGRTLIEDLGAQGALLTMEDLGRHTTRIEPAPAVHFHGRRLHFAPPNSQGLALGLLAGLWDVLRHRPEAAGGLNPALYLRIKQLAFKYRDRYAVDPQRSGLPADLLEPERLERMLDEESPPREFEARSGGGDTSTFVVMDRWGNAVSWVQSLFEDFGSGVLSPRTGIVMHDRLYLESLEADSVHRLTPGERPFHTLCPALLLSDGACEMAIATPGDHGQPQSIFQVLVNVFDLGQNVQAAIEAPRMRHDSGGHVMIESRVPAPWRDAIGSCGFECRDVGAWSRLMGGVNAIQRGPDGVFWSGADPRRSCYVVCA